MRQREGQGEDPQWSRQAPPGLAAAHREPSRFPPTIRRAGSAERLHLVKESSSPLTCLHGSMAGSRREAGGVLWETMRRREKSRICLRARETHEQLLLFLNREARWPGSCGWPGSDTVLSLEGGFGAFGAKIEYRGPAMVTGNTDPALLTASALCRLKKGLSGPGWCGSVDRTSA